MEGKALAARVTHTLKGVLYESRDSDICGTNAAGFVDGDGTLLKMIVESVPASRGKRVVRVVAGDGQASLVEGLEGCLAAAGVGWQVYEHWKPVQISESLDSVVAAFLDALATSATDGAVAARGLATLGIMAGFAPVHGFDLLHAVALAAAGWLGQPDSARLVLHSFVHAVAGGAIELAGSADAVPSSSPALPQVAAAGMELLAGILGCLAGVSDDIAEQVYDEVAERVGNSSDAEFIPEAAFAASRLVAAAASADTADVALASGAPPQPSGGTGVVAGVDRLGSLDRVVGGSCTAGLLPPGLSPPPPSLVEAQGQVAALQRRIRELEAAALSTTPPPGARPAPPPFVPGADGGTAPTGASSLLASLPSAAVPPGLTAMPDRPDPGLVPARLPFGSSPLQSSTVDGVRDGWGAAAGKKELDTRCRLSSIRT